MTKQQRGRVLRAVSSIIKGRKDRWQLCRAVEQGRCYHVSLTSKQIGVKG